MVHDYHDSALFWNGGATAAAGRYSRVISDFIQTVLFPVSCGEVWGEGGRMEKMSSFKNMDF